jgi:hypothetical protein
MLHLSGYELYMNAALAGASSAVTIVATVLLLPAATTIFGVGGGNDTPTLERVLNQFQVIRVGMKSINFANVDTR